MRRRFTGLEPDRLPDPGRPGVEDTLGLLFPVLLAPRNGHVSTGVFGPHYEDLVPGFAREGVCHVGGEWRVSALVGGYLRAVHPDRRAVVHGAEVEQEPLVARRRILEGAGVPDDVVEGCLPDAGELRLVAVGDDYLRSVERRVTGRDVRGDTSASRWRARSRNRRRRSSTRRSDSSSPSAAELRTRVLGSWDRDQGTVPFLLEVRAIRSEDRGRRSAR